MAVATGNFAELLWPGILDLWGVSYKDYEPLYTKIFETKKSDKAFEKFQGVTGLGLASVKDQGQSVAYQNPFQGFQKEFVNVTYGIGATVTKEMWSDDQYDYINKLPKMLARSMRQTEETIAFNHFNNGSTAGVTGADGVTLFSTAHPLVGGGTFSNQAATSADLSQTALEALLAMLLDAVDDQGLHIRLMPVALVVPTASNFISRKLLETDFVVGSADNDKNPIPGLFKTLVVSPYLTDADAFHITSDVDNGFVWLQRWAAELERDNEFDTKNLKFTLTNRFDSGWVDPRCVYHNPGA